MNNEEIIEGNKLISEFMGYDKNWRQNHPEETPDENFFYHSSWDWLMEAWHKFRDLRFSFEDEQKNTMLMRYCYRISAAMSWMAGIEDSFEKLVEGIKWYNQNPLTDN